MHFLSKVVKKIVDFLVSNNCEESCSEIIKTAEFIFAIPGYVYCEREFFMINAQSMSRVEETKLFIKNMKH